MSTWLPEEEPLRQLISFLHDSLSGRDLNVQRKAEMVSREQRAQNKKSKN